MSEIEQLKSGLTDVYSRVSDTEAHILLQHNIRTLRSRIRSEYSSGPVFWEPAGFFGNSKYLFLAWDEFSRSSSRPRPIWLTPDLKVFESLQEQGFESVLWKHSQTGFMATKKLLLSPALFCSAIDYLPPLGVALIYELFRGKPIIQMWHGIATKDITAPWKQMDLTTLLASMNVMIKPTHLILPTRVRDLEAFFGNPRRVAALSPRNWPLVEGFHSEKTAKATELIVYAPTFSTEKDESVQVEIALRLASFASARGFEFQVKPHPNHGRDFSRCLLSQGLVPVDSQFDLQQLLADASVLVTDVSSASIDFLLRNKPIVFTLWDEMEIVRDNSEVLRSRAIPGLVSSNREDLESVLNSAITEDLLKKQRLFASKRYHGAKRTTPQSLVRRLRHEIRFYMFTSKFGKK